MYARKGRRPTTTLWSPARRVPCLRTRSATAGARALRHVNRVAPHNPELTLHDVHCALHRAAHSSPPSKGTSGATFCAHTFATGWNLTAKRRCISSGYLRSTLGACLELPHACVHASLRAALRKSRLSMPFDMINPLPLHLLASHLQAIHAHLRDLQGRWSSGLRSLDAMPARRCRWP